MNESDQNVGDPDETFLALTNRMCDGTITPDELERLGGLLREDPERRETYLAYVSLHAHLMWQYRTGESAANLASDRAADPGVATGGDLSCGVEPSQRVSGTAGGFTTWLASRPVTVGAVLATAVLALLGVTLIPWSGRATIGTEDRPTTTATPFVATLRETSGAFWTDQQVALNAGARVPTGEVRIERGEAELVFDSGAQLILRGPARMTLESSLSASLHSGQLVAHMPSTAVGFRVQTPTAVFVDQGTEFGLLAEPDGTSEVHVFRGQVDVLALAEDGGAAAANPLELVDGQARRISQRGNVGSQVAYSKARFGLLSQRVAEPIAWPVAEGGNGHYYQLVISDKPVTWHEAALKSANTYFRGLPGHLASVTSAAEDEFIVGQLIRQEPIRGIWIGLTDVLKESQFQWITGEPVEYTHWANVPTQQPDNFREADWHGGEDYGMYSKLLPKYPWAWNDLSIDSMHEKVSAYLVEYEPAVNTLRQTSMSLPPVRWDESEGGNGHHYRLVLSFESASWQEVRQRAQDSQFNGVAGDLVSLQSDAEMQFVIEKLLRVCGIPEQMIGLSGSSFEDLTWTDGSDPDTAQIGKPLLPANGFYGLLRWDATRNHPPSYGWSIQTRAMDVQPSDWFGYIVEYPDDIP
ncbi:hypothetical protein FYK55_26670 [Roseiconus nitratireducens]|uniref:C-type lectin domain-containing protein n=1 Tax=Roseiconus nitratireducens TaxID=2605748 RepID=A0A5M6CWD4_9BACT|nr:lectin-like protein [Roseiconus nitratireducens]KAA5538700.1 hypothetical protein FYK55_26670 [Roseiconus nitratireducens]